MNPSASIVIPSYGRADLLRRTLQSLAAADWSDTFTGVWVVENGPLTGLHSVCEEFAPHVPMHYVHEPELGLSAARNAGAKACDGDFILFLDNDLRLEPAALKAYSAAFSEYPAAAVFGGPLAPEYEIPPPDWLRPYLPWSAAGMDLGRSNKVIDQPFLMGGNHAVSRTALEAAGYYDPVGATADRGGVGEETRLQQRVLSAGQQLVYVASALVWHWVPTSNCSPQWVLGREFRHGLTKALTDRPSGRVRLAGVPLWVLRRWLRVTLRVLAGRMRLHSPKRRFATEYEQAYWAGLLMGCRRRII